MQLGNLSHEVAQVTVNNIVQGVWDLRYLYICSGLFVVVTIEVPANFSMVSYFVACTVNATSDSIYLPMQNGRTTQNISLPANPQSNPWTVWSPGPTTDLTQMVCELVHIAFSISWWISYTVVQHCSGRTLFIYYIFKWSPNLSTSATSSYIWRMWIYVHGWCVSLNIVCNFCEAVIYLN